MTNHSYLVLNVKEEYTNRFLIFLKFTTDSKGIKIQNDLSYFYEKVHRNYSELTHWIFPFSFPDTLLYKKEYLILDNVFEIAHRTFDDYIIEQDNFLQIENIGYHVPGIDKKTVLRYLSTNYYVD